MVILLAGLVIGSLVWLVRQRRDSRVPARGAEPRLPERPPGGPALGGPPPGGPLIPRELLSRGRIVVTGLTKEYQGYRAVDDLSFDPEGISWLCDLLRTLATGGRTIPLSSHLLAEVEQVADDVIIIADGRLIAQGTMTSVTGSMTGASRTQVRTRQLAELAAELGSEVAVTSAGDGDVYITGAGAAMIGDAAQRAGVAPHQLTTQRPDLEAAFLELTAGTAGIR